MIATVTFALVALALALPGLVLLVFSGLAVAHERELSKDFGSPLIPRTP